MKKELFIISNESIYSNKNKFYCDNLDLKSIPEGLDKIFDVTVVARKSKLERYHLIENVKTIIATSLLSFTKIIIKSLNNKENSRYIIISISPYTFIASIVLFLFKIKPLVYLRSDGYEEYKSISGFIGIIIYHFMFSVVAKISNLISCRKHILRNKNGKIVSPSQLTKIWFENHKYTNLKSSKVKILYVGRLRVEKGIFSFLKIFKHLNENIEFTIVASKKDHNKIKTQKNIYLLEALTEKSLVEAYDKNNILILPSFTEGHPQVLDEALSRLKPVIVFNEISHVKRDREGVFVCERNIKDFKKTIDYVMNNFDLIQSKIKKNKLPDRKSFLKELENLIKNSNNKERWPSG